MKQGLHICSPGAEFRLANEWHRTVMSASWGITAVQPNLVNNAPLLVENMQREVAAQFARQADIDALIGSLKKAGIPIPE